MLLSYSVRQDIVERVQSASLLFALLGCIGGSCNMTPGSNKVLMSDVQLETQDCVAVVLLVNIKHD